jgi:serine/threonine protein phosphatase PrpC
MLEIESAYLSELGGRQRNEDACGYWTSERACCWVVSDGAGGHGSGDIASRIVVSHTLERFSAEPTVSPEHIVELLRGANDAVIREKNSGSTRDDMHATAAILALDRERGLAIWGHAGDTRLYLFRDGTMSYRTRDHSLVQSLIDAGYGGEEMIRSHPQRSLLTSAIGSAESVELSVASEMLRVQPGDVFLLCTDGWWEYVEESEMQTLLSCATSSHEWLALMSEAIKAKVTGQNDNYTAMCVTVGHEESATTVIFPSGPEAA